MVAQIVYQYGLLSRQLDPSLFWPCVLGTEGPGVDWSANFIDEQGYGRLNRPRLVDKRDPSYAWEV